MTSSSSSLHGKAQTSLALRLLCSSVLRGAHPHPFRSFRVFRCSKDFLRFLREAHQIGKGTSKDTKKTNYPTTPQRHRFLIDFQKILDRFDFRLPPPCMAKLKRVWLCACFVRRFCAKRIIKPIDCSSSKKSLENLKENLRKSF